MTYQEKTIFLAIFFWNFLARKFEFSWKKIQIFLEKTSEIFLGFLDGFASHFWKKNVDFFGDKIGILKKVQIFPQELLPNQKTENTERNATQTEKPPDLYAHFSGARALENLPAFLGGGRLPLAEPKTRFLRFLYFWVSQRFDFFGFCVFG